MIIIVLSAHVHAHGDDPQHTHILAAMLAGVTVCSQGVPLLVLGLMVSVVAPTREAHNSFVVLAHIWLQGLVSHLVLQCQES